ncbi:MAG: hypothetical protein ACO1TE_29130 [Prosthecobacter sp.]
MAFLSIQLEATARLTPYLVELLQSLDLSNQNEFFSDVADAFETITSLHITQASRTRHKTAYKLGATPTGYLERLAGTVEASPAPGRVRMTVQGDIFKRAFGEVEVTAQQAEMLTIPWHAEAHGRRAREFDNLFVYQSKQGRSFLARPGASKGKLEFMYLLKKSVTLPQDRGLLPGDDAYLAEAERIAAAYVDAQLVKLSGQ